MQPNSIRRFVTPILSLAAIGMPLSSTIARAQEQMWVSSDTLNRRTCPSTTCGVVGTLAFRESAVVLETRDEWARITEPYDASCTSGQSPYVDSGEARCVEINGIVEGEFAEWVSMRSLVADRPADQGAGTTGTAALVRDSSDFRLHETAFVAAAEKLIAAGQCTAKDLSDNGGFVKSTTGGPTVYFTYCRNGDDRIYLDVADGRTYR